MTICACARKRSEALQQQARHSKPQKKLQIFPVDFDLIIESFAKLLGQNLVITVMINKTLYSKNPRFDYCHFKSSARFGLDCLEDGENRWLRNVYELYWVTFQKTRIILTTMIRQFLADLTLKRHFGKSFCKDWWEIIVLKDLFRLTGR